MKTALAALALSAVGVSGITYAVSSESEPLDEKVTLAEPSPAEPVVISSASDQALSPPSTWSCDKYLPEYQAYLEQGNDPTEWRFFGQIYEEVETGEQYAWSDWIDWVNDNGCVDVALVQPESAILAPAALWPGLIGPAVPAGAAAGSSLISRGDAKSPG